MTENLADRAEDVAYLVGKWLYDENTRGKELVVRLR